MPDLLGYDSRTRKSKLANYFLSSVLSHGLNRLYYTAAYHNTKNPMPPLSSHRTRVRRWFPSRRKRRAYRRRYRRPGRGVSAKYIAGKGLLQKRFPRLPLRRLNTNLMRNQYDSTREIVFSQRIMASSTGTTFQPINFRVTDFALANAKLPDYDEYKMSNIQYVFTPINLANGAKELQMNSNFDPYIYIYVQRTPGTPAATPTLQNIKDTPGVQRYSMLRRKPIVINVPFSALRDRALLSGTGETQIDVESTMQKISWIRNPTPPGGTVNPSDFPEFGNLRVFIPTITSASQFVPAWRVEIYATVLLRGNRKLILDS